MAKKEMAPTRELASKVMFAALSILKENDGEMPMREVLKAVEKRVNLDDWARNRYEKTGNIRWKSVLQFYSIDYVKAGYLVKKKGVWYLTPEGYDALKRGPVGLLESAEKAYREWKSCQIPKNEDEESVVVEEAAEEEIKVYLRDFYEDELDEESGWVFTYFNGMVCVNIESIEELDIERFLNFITVNNVKDS